VNIKKSKIFICFLVLLFANISRIDAEEFLDYDFYTEWCFLQEQFHEMEIPKIELDEIYLEKIQQNALQELSTITDPSMRHNQCFLYVDKNTDRQIIFIFIYNVNQNKIYTIGRDLVSTGNKKRVGYWETPSGILENSLKFIGYRALGTKNDKGWMGLGIKGSRVWDFGWQITKKKARSKIKVRKIRLLLHATDPVDGEKRLGKANSMGCIRISAKLNNYLDYFGIIDKEYEARSKQKNVSWLLRKERRPTLLAGKFVIVKNSNNL
jgi:hypothetical protein